MADEFYICPACGAEVKIGTERCPTCHPPKPWEQDEHLDGVNLDQSEDDTFDYDRFVADEFGSGSRPAGIGKIWVVSAIVLLLALGMARFFF